MKTFLWLLQLLIELIWPRKKMDINVNIPTTAPDPLAVVTGAENLAAEALKAGLTITEYKNTPAYLAGLAAKQEQLERDTDEAVAVKAAAGDPEAVAELQRRSS